MEREPQHEQQPGYYGTGRPPKEKKSQLPLILSLIVVVLLINTISIVIRTELQKEASVAETTLQEPEDVDLMLPKRNEGCAAERSDVIFGMSVSAMEDCQRRYWDLPEGVMVEQILLHSGAHLAGIRTGDVLLSVDEVRVTDPAAYCAAMQNFASGDVVKIVLYRNGEEIETELLLP